MTEKYELMCWFGVATLHVYRGDIVPLTEGETYGDFATKNTKVIKRVFDQALSLYKYE